MKLDIPEHITIDPVEFMARVSSLAYGLMEDHRVKPGPAYIQAMALLLVEIAFPNAPDEALYDLDLALTQASLARVQRLKEEQTP